MWLNTTLHNVAHPFTPYCTLHTPHSATHNAQYILHTTYLTLHESTLHSVKYHKPLTPHSTVLHTTNSTLLKSSASLHAGKTYQGFANCFFESAICKFLLFWTTPLIRYITNSKYLTGNTMLKNECELHKTSLCASLASLFNSNAEFLDKEEW